MKIVALSTDKLYVEQVRQMLASDDAPAHTLLPLEGGVYRLAAVAD